MLLWKRVATVAVQYTEIFVVTGRVCVCRAA